MLRRNNFQCLFQISCVQRQCQSCGVESFREDLHAQLEGSDTTGQLVSWFQWDRYKDTKGKPKVDKFQKTGTAFELVQALITDVCIIDCRIVLLFLDFHHSFVFHMTMNSLPIVCIPEQ